MIRVVLDTNVIISALFWRGAPHQVVKKGLVGAFTIVTSKAILDETLDRLIHKFGFPIPDARALIEVITLNSNIIVPTTNVKVIKDDPSDDKIIECALDGMAQYVITGDHHLLVLKEYQGIIIITPAEFLHCL